MTAGGEGSQPAADDAETPHAAARYSVQLIDAYVVRLSASRRPSAEVEQEAGSIEVAQPEWHRDDDGRHFAVVWAADVVAPLGGLTAEVSCAVEGQFGSDEPLSEEDFEVFREREAFVLLWPYLRAAVGEAGRMLGLLVPPLPTVDVRSILGAANAEPVEEQGTDPETG